jgi:hypothetical protein
MAAKLAKRLFGFYRPQDVNDPEVFLSGVMKLFLAYPVAAAKAAVDPVDGLPSRSSFAPAIAEIKAFLESYKQLPSEEKLAELREAYRQKKLRANG